MADEQQVAPAEVETEQVETEETTTQETEVEEDSTDYKGLAEKNQKAFEDQKKRAEKAEAALKAATKKSNSDELSSKDVLALSSSGITDEEDVEFLQKAARINGTTIAQAINDPTVAGILKGKQEERQTAAATSTGGSRRAPIERKGSDILAAAKPDNMPASGKDTRRMIRASMGLKD